MDFTEQINQILYSSGINKDDKKDYTFSINSTLKTALKEHHNRMKKSIKKDR